MGALQLGGRSWSTRLGPAAASPGASLRRGRLTAPGAVRGQIWGSLILKGALVPPLVTLKLGGVTASSLGGVTASIGICRLGGVTALGLGASLPRRENLGDTFGWNAEMDEGIEGRSGVTLAGSNSVGLRT